MNLFAVLVVLAAGACKLKDTRFQPGDSDDAGVGDGGIDAPDAPPSGPPELMVSAMDVIVTEGQTQPFTVALTAPPSSAMLVNIELSDDLKVGAAPAALLFTPTDWSAPQTVTLTGKSDADISDETLSVTVRSPSITTPVTIGVTVDDDDGLSLMLASTMMDIGEGTTGTITARLSAQPVSDIVVAIATSDMAVATISQQMFTFTPANWAIEQNLSVTGMQDANTTNGTATISFMSALLTSANVIVQVTDDDVLGISTSTSAIAATEGETQTFAVTLTQQPPATVTVNLAAVSTTIATVGAGTLTFTTTDWSTPQTVSVTAVQDDDVADGGTTITLMASGLTTRSVNLTVTDDDEQSIVTAPATNLDVDEGGSGSISVRLAYRPANDVTVSAASLDTSAATVSPAMLTFSPANYTVGQPVMVTGVQDADAADDATTVRFEIAAQGLINNVATTINDDDTLGIDISATTAALTEGGAAMFQVRLSAQPTANTTVAVSSGDTTSVTVSPASLSFTSGNWNVYQTATLTGVEDNDLVGESVTMAVTSAGLTTRNVAVTVTDNDTQAFTTTLPAVTVTEGASTTIGVRLAYQPAANVTVAVTSSAPGVATAGPTPLTFTNGNWNTSQNVTITGVEDADAVNGMANLVLMASGITTAMIPITVTDNDALNIDLSPTSFTVVEGSTATLQVRLTAMPAATTTVNLASSDTNSATVSLASVSFTTGDWNTYKSVTVTGVQDTDAGDEAVTITATATGLSDRTASVTVDDDETLAIVTSVGSVAVTEGGTATFQVRLSAQPGATTTVNLASSDNNAATVTASLSFTTTNWSMNQTATVTGIQDADVAGESVTFTLSGMGMSNQTVTGTVTDDDTQAVLVTPTTRTITEGTSSTVNVTLQYQPSGNYTVSVASNATGVATVSPSTLTFNAGNYQTAQVVTITGAEDANAVENATTVSLTGSAATSGSVSVTVPDNDVLGIDLEQTTLTINEGGNGTFRVRLTAEPAATTVVALGSSDLGAATVTTSLSFGTGSWNIWQTATVVGVEDADAGNENVTISATSAALTTRTVAVTVNDNEVQSIIINLTSATLVEGVPGPNVVTVGIRLAAAPPSDVIVSIASIDPGAVSTSVASRTFTSGNYNTDQFVTLTAVGDPDRNFEQVAVNFTATGLATRTTNVRVNEPTILEPMTTSFSVCEGGSYDLGVRLEGNPIDVMTVNAVNNNARCSVSPSSRSYSSGNFSTYQYFTVQGNSPGASSITVSSPTIGVTPENISVDVLSSNLIECGGPGTCGDGTCTTAEMNSCSCASDCGPCSGYCGDGTCSYDESLACNCFEDCGPGCS
ncbi:MAG: beta strand repeat-containing protein [Kofleriaceae bacterium]